MSHTVTLRIDNESYKVFSSRARAEKRPLSNFIEVAALEYARESSFVDDIEMEEILSNKRLLRRLKEGSRQARRRKGKFVA